MSAYTYTELQDDEVRLLKLKSGSLSSDLEANLLIYRLLDDEEESSAERPFILTRELEGQEVQVAPPYQALSYVWGEDEPRTSIKILQDDEYHLIPIRPNLNTALRRFRRTIKTGESQLLWIDALCICQADVTEKNAQIQKMALIYNRAFNVCVWLGESTNDSKKAIDFVNRLQELENFDQLVNDPVTPTEWAAFLNLMRRPWFNRRWIVQEIAIARKATVYCGPDHVSWLDFANAVSLFTSRHHDLSKLFKRAEEFDNNPDFLGEVDALGAASLVRAVNNLFRKSDDGTPLERLYSLEALMSELTAFKASKPHDTIYAILWLSHDAEPGSKGSAIYMATQVVHTPVGSPTLDPTTPPTDVVQSPAEFSQFTMIGDTTHFSPVANSAAPLQRTQPESLYPPSQTRGGKPRSSSAVDSSLKRAERQFTKDPEPIEVDYDKTVYEVCKEFVEFVVKRSKSLDIICRPWAPLPEPDKPEPALPSWISSISGAPFGIRRSDKRYARVKADPLVGTPGTGLRNYNACGKTRAYWDQQFILDDRTMKVTGFELDAIEEVEDAANGGVIPDSWLHLANWTNPADPPPERFWRTLVADRGSDGQKPPPAYFHLACKWSFDRKPEQDGLNTRELLLQGRCPSIVAEFIRRVQAVVWNRRLVLTEGRKGSKRLLGLVPAGTRAGDLVCILYGCSVPVVLRKKNKRKRDANASGNVKNNGPGSAQNQFSPPRNVKDPRLRPKNRSSKSPSPLRVAEPPIDTTHASTSIRKAFEARVRKSLPPGKTDLKISIDNVNQYEFIGDAYIQGMMAGEGFRHRQEHGNKLKEFHLV